MSFKIELGSKVKDRVTGFTGIVAHRSEHLYGCRRYGVQPEKMKDGKPIDALWFDEDALEILKQAAPHKMKNTGGPQPVPPKRAMPKR